MFGTSAFALGSNGKDPDKEFTTVEYKDSIGNNYEKYYFLDGKIAGVILLGNISKPLNPYRVIVIVGCIAGLFITAWQLNWLFDMHPVSQHTNLYVASCYRYGQALPDFLYFSSLLIDLGYESFLSLCYSPLSCINFKTGSFYLFS